MHVLEQIRIKDKLKKVQMAERLGIAKSYYSMIIKDNKPLSKNVAVKIHCEFGIPLEELLYPEVHAEETNHKTRAG